MYRKDENKEKAAENGPMFLTFTYRKRANVIL